MPVEHEEIFLNTVAAMKTAKGPCLRATRDPTQNITAMDGIIARDTARRLASHVGADAGYEVYDSWQDNDERNRARRSARSAGEDSTSKFNLPGRVIGAVGGWLGGGVGWRPGRYGRGDVTTERRRGVNEAGAVGTAAGATIAGATGSGIAVLLPALLFPPAIPFAVIGGLAVGGIWGGVIGNRSGRAGGEVGFDEGRRRRDNLRRGQDDEIALRTEEDVDISLLMRLYDPQFTHQRITHDGGRILCEGCEISFPRGAFSSGQVIKALTIRGSDLFPLDHIGVARILHIKFDGELNKAAKFWFDSKCGPYSIGEERPITFSLYRLENDFTWAPIDVAVDVDGRRITFHYDRPGILIVTIKTEWENLVEWY